MRPALIVIDMQNDFKKGASAYSCEMLDETLLENTRQLIELCRKKNIPVIYTQHSIKPDKSNAELGEPYDVRVCIIGTPGWEIIREIRPEKNDAVVMKDKYDAFYGTQLEKILRKHKADTAIICGVLSNNCIRATSESAHYRGFGLIIVKNCCGATSYLSDLTHEQIHDITLRDLGERIYDTRLLTLEELGKII